MPNPYFVNISTPFSSPLTDDLTSSSLTDLLRKREEGNRLNDHESRKIVLLRILKQEERRFKWKWSQKRTRKSYARQLKIVNELRGLCLSYLRNQAYTTSWNVGDRICEVCDLPNRWYREHPYVWEFEPNVKLSIGLCAPPPTQTESDREQAGFVTISLDEQYRNHKNLQNMGYGVVLCENTPANQREIEFMLKMHKYRKKLQNDLNRMKKP